MHLQQWFELNLAFGKVEGGGFDKKKWVLEVIGPTRSAMGIGGCGAQYLTYPNHYVPRLQ